MNFSAGKVSKKAKGKILVPKYRGNQRLTGKVDGTVGSKPVDPMSDIDGGSASKNGSSTRH